MRTRSFVPAVIAAIAIWGCAQTDESSPEAADDASSMASTEATPEYEARRMAAEKGIESGEGGEWAFGAEMGGGEAVTVAALNEHPEMYAGKVVKIEGTVSSVCQQMGCWVEVTGAEGETIMAASENHDVLLPRNSKGKPIALEGRFQATAPEAEGGATTYSLTLDAASISASAS